MFNKMHLLGYLGLSIWLIGCGGTSSEKVIAANPMKADVSVTPADGVSAFFDQLGYIEIPAQAVTQPSLLKVTKNSKQQYPSQQLLVSDGYVLSLTQPRLLVAATLTLPIDLASASDQKLVISQFVDGQWVENLTSLQQDNVVSASITAMGTYAVKQLAPVHATKIIGPLCDIAATEQKIQFVHVADLHSRFGFQEQLYSKLKSIHRSALADNLYTLFTNGGDDFEKGTVAEQLSTGMASAQATKAMEFDIRVIGNHDFAWGEQLLLEHANDTNSLVVASNTQYVGNQQTPFNALHFGIVEIGCIKLGVFGMSSVPWNELDRPFKAPLIPDFIPNFQMFWHQERLAQGIVAAYGDQVDYMVMVSHLGVSSDLEIANNVAGIDLVLGGHSHQGASLRQLDNQAIVVQPDFYGEGATLVNLTFDLSDKSLTALDHVNIETRDINAADPTVAAKIDQIMAQHAPNANTEIAISENYPTAVDITAITAKALAYTDSIDATLLDPEQVWQLWLPGTLTQETIHQTYFVERQPANTSGFNALYRVNVTGAQLATMAQAQPEWAYYPPQNVEPEASYSVALHKGVALNPSLFFQGISFEKPQLLAEAWDILERYSRYRTSQCLHIDSALVLHSCQPDTAITIWQFDDPRDPFKVDSGPSQMSFFDPTQSDWPTKTELFSNTTELAIADLPDGPANVLHFQRHSPDQGLKIVHHVAPNGDFKAQGQVSDYSLVFDIMWPQDAQLVYRSLLQTDPQNLDDADITFEGVANGGVGKSTSSSGFFGQMLPDTWYRVALVFYAGHDDGVFKVFINGVLVGQKTEREIDQRWALSSEFLLFSDPNGQTHSGYLNALLFAGRAMTATEIAQLAGPSQRLTFNQDIRTLNQSIKRHYQSVDSITDSHHH